MDKPTFEEIMRSSKARSWLKGFARRVAPQSVSYEDLEAEGMIAMWKAYDKGNATSNLDSYLIRAAKWQILRVLDRRQWTGQDKSPGAGFRGNQWQRADAPAGRIHPDQVEQLYPDDVMRDWDEVSGSEHGYHLAELDDLRSAVREAVAALSPSQRDRVFRKFWLDESVPLSGNWWRDPRWGVRARLVEKLAHLTSAS